MDLFEKFQVRILLNLHDAEVLADDERYQLLLLVIQKEFREGFLLMNIVEGHFLVSREVERIEGFF
jgi:hypothetical protein